MKSYLLEEASRIRADGMRGGCEASLAESIKRRTSVRKAKNSSPIAEFGLL